MCKGRHKYSQDGCEVDTMLQVVKHGNGNVCTLKKVDPAEQEEVKQEFLEQAEASKETSTPHTWM